MSRIVIKHLAEQRHVLPTLRAWFESEWPVYYGAGGHGNAEQDLLAYANSRGQGIGRALLLALEPEARALGYSRIYCATSTSESLLQRCGWHLLEVVQHEGHAAGVYEKALWPLGVT